MQPESAFAAVVLTQVAGLLVIAKVYRVSRRALFQAAIAGLGFGLVLGIAFDFLIGKLAEVFTYRAQVTVTFVILNGTLSYGTAFASIMILPKSLSNSISQKIGTILLVVAFALAAVVAFLPLHFLSELLLLGVTVLCAGEGLSVRMRRLGPLLAVFRHDLRGFLRLWTVSAGLGALYEGANFLWPVWKWEAARRLGVAAWWMLLIGFGYFVLFHPMWVLSSFLRHPGSESE